MQRSFAFIAVLFSLSFCLSAAALAASGREPAPPGSFPGAPPQYTQFSTSELTRGFMALAFGSDLRVGAVPRGIRRFDRPIAALIVPGGSVDRTAAITRILEEYAGKVPNLKLTVTSDPNRPHDLEVRLIDEKNFRSAMEEAFGSKIARDFVKRTNPQCMTSVKSGAGGEIVRAVTFVIVDKGDYVFLDCAYHELLHAFGLSNHAPRNPWTTLNQRRRVGYLSVYDRALLTMLYDARIAPDMTEGQVRARLPEVINNLGLAAMSDGH